MPHHNSVFRDLLKWVPWAEFDRLTTEHGADHRVRRLPTKNQFIALLYGQFSGAANLREIVGGVESHAVRLYHVGGGRVTGSTLADANAVRPSAVFSELFSHMVTRTQRSLRRVIGEAVYLIDSTGIRRSGSGSEWARFSAKVLRILCNDLDATAQEIADLYKRRWAIELFFRWVKQTLKIRHFLGTSENAVRIRIAVALIAFLLLRLALAAQNAVESPLAFARLVRANLMLRKRIDRLIGADPAPRIDPNQRVPQWG